MSLDHTKYKTFHMFRVFESSMQRRSGFTQYTFLDCVDTWRCNRFYTRGFEISYEIRELLLLLGSVKLWIITAAFHKELSYVQIFL